MEEKNEAFTYTYSAARRQEVERIRKKYAPPTRDEDKMDLLLRMDRDAGRPGTILAVAAGVLGCLALGLGMSCTMVWGGALFVPGIAVGGFGILAICAAYPLYAHITRKQREKLAPEILRLTDELLK